MKRFHLERRLEKNSKCRLQLDFKIVILKNQKIFVCLHVLCSLYVNTLNIYSLWGKAYIFSLQKFSISTSHKFFVRSCDLY